MNIEILSAGSVAYSVFMAVDGDAFLPVGVPVTLEYLSDDHDGIFPTAASWRGFVNGNFRQDGDLYLEGDVKESTLKKYCFPLDQYRDKFAAQVGSDKWVRVNADDLEFKFTYDLNKYRRRDNFPCAVEIFVTATIKE